MFGVEQLFTEMVKAPEVVLVRCLPKVSVGDGAQFAFLSVVRAKHQSRAAPVVTVIVRPRLARRFAQVNWSPSL
jgi:hypothetical protein